ncbi:hypothetical protein PPERSA_07311 [Pseudocohnilembus persalinus]|uniref:Uncharacterized protein n=1 Tax=Pseudocohnilembus persalinus TaxID=266149 RepID=A0A0V0R6X7_PSEPJ|nr:hypothetical protein PPERSA_07311 [Pseudocohnilembus persalinus]|eukprot:KRX10226.1 hypothetical protein PPERSA_07311 [Pseudocohnilembus persalinus]
MKRTKEAYFRPHQQPEQTEGMSGLREFDGEDLAFDSRRQYQKQQQKFWLEQQMQENKMKKLQEKQEEQAYAIQTMEINRMRGMLEDEFNQKKAELRAAQRETNEQLSKQRKDEIEQEKQKRLNYEQDEVRTTLQRGVKRPYP